MAATILHLDLDAFFASVEVKRDPSLRGKPVVVGGSGPRGVVAACTYEARSYGVRSAMSSAEAQRRCPHAVFVSGSYQDYASESEAVFNVVRDVTPDLEFVSLDEAFCDITPALRRLGGADSLARNLRARIADECQLQASVGVAPTKMVAKLASEAAKPIPGPPGTGPRPGAGVVIIEPHEVSAFLRPLPIRAMWGVGPATHARLDRLGIRTVGDLADTPMPSLIAALGSRSAHHLFDLANGEDPRDVESDRVAKSIGQEETFSSDRITHEQLDRDVVRIADAAARRLRESGTTVRTVTIKVKFSDFTSITRSQTLPAVTTDPVVIRDVARRLLDEVDVSPGVRLFGASLSRLGEDVVEQLSFDQALSGAPVDVADNLDAPPTDGEVRERAAEAIDAIRARFGAGAVGPASLVEDGSLRVRGDRERPRGPDKEPPS